MKEKGGEMKAVWLVYIQPLYSREMHDADERSEGSGNVRSG